MVLFYPFLKPPCSFHIGYLIEVMNWRGSTVITKSSVARGIANVLTNPRPCRPYFFPGSAGGKSSACVFSPSLLYIGYNNTGKVSMVLKCLMLLGRVSMVPGIILRNTRDDSLASLNRCRRMEKVPAPISTASCFVSRRLAGPFSNLMSSIEAEDTWEAGL